MQPIDCRLWTAGMLTQSKPEPPLCPKFFETCAERVLFRLHLSKDDITHTNCRNIYIKLVRHIEVLVQDGTFRMPLRFDM